MVKNCAIRRHYEIRKYVACDLKGERCGYDTAYNKSCKPDCKNCDFFKEMENE